MGEALFELGIAAFIGALLVYFLPTFSIKGIKKPVIVAIYFIKVIAGFLVYWLYAFHFGGGDIFLYYTDGVALAELFQKDIGLGLRYWLGIADSETIKSILPHTIAWDYSDCRSIIRLNAITFAFTGHNYFINAAIINIFFLHSGVLLFKTLYRYFDFNKYYLLSAIFLVPSICFWGSSFLKDALFLMALLYFLSALINFFFLKTSTTIFWLIASILLMAWIKPLSLIFLVPGSIYLIFHKPIEKIGRLKSMVLFLVGSGILLQLLTLLPYPYNPLELLCNYQQKHIELASEGWSSNSMFYVPKISQNVGVFFSQLVLGIINSLIQPIHLQGKLLNGFQLLENILLICGSAYLAIKRIKAQQILHPIEIFILLTVISSYSLLGLSVPIAGALVRYKIFALSFLCILIIPKSIYIKNQVAR